MDQMDSAPIITEELLPLLNNEDLGALGFACVTRSVRESTETRSCNPHKEKRIKSLRANRKKKKKYSNKSPVLPCSIKFTHIVTPLNLKERSLENRC